MNGNDNAHCSICLLLAADAQSVLALMKQLKFDGV
jgi:hypothetical protein